MPNTEKPAAAASKPRTRQRVHKQAPPIAVPDINEDAAERKRVLNVLAQRRYRQRKRQSRLAATGESSGSSKPSSPPIEDHPPCPDTTKCDAIAPIPAEPPQSLDNFQLEFEALQWIRSGPGDSVGPGAALLETIDLSLSDMVNGALAPSASGTSTTSLTDSSWPPLPDMELVSTSSGSSFPDSYLLPVNELTLLRAMLRIAERLKAEKFWELAAVSSFNLGTGPPNDQLPSTWQPTATQLLVPHHPLVDFLPWPTSRDRMLDILSLPEEVRPPAAQDPLALVNFAYDMEDSAEGLRIWGDDPYDEKSWEIGQLVFERWWFIFDRKVIERSNHWRRLRGAPPLRITACPS